MSQTNDSIYKLINELRLEIKGDIKAQGEDLSGKLGKLDKKLDNVVEKRIVPIEERVEKLKIDSATGNVKLAVVFSIFSTLVASVVSVVLSRVFK